MRLEVSERLTTHPQVGFADQPMAPLFDGPITLQPDHPIHTILTPITLPGSEEGHR
jgi:hypothetical protein